jgi:hypothetical protein
MLVSSLRTSQRISSQLRSPASTARSRKSSCSARITKSLYVSSAKLARPISVHLASSTIADTSSSNKTIQVLFTKVLFTCLVALLKERAGELKEKVSKKLVDMTNSKSFGEKCRENIVLTKEEQLKHIDEEFERLFAKLNDRKNFLKKTYQQLCAEELSNIDTDISKLDNHIDSLKKHVTSIDKYFEK